MSGAHRTVCPSISLMCTTSLVAIALLLLIPGAGDSSPAAANSVHLDAVVNSGNFASGKPVAPGTIVTLFGGGFAAGTAVATDTPLPGSLGGVSVAVNGVIAPLFFVSPNQINLQVPFEVSGSQATVVVNTGPAQSAPLAISLTAASPAIYTVLSNGSGPGAITHADGNLISRDNPVQPGETVIVYGTGFGAVKPAVSSGAAAPGPPGFAQLTTTPRVQFDGFDAAILYAGLAPAQVGLYQINAQVPKGVKSPYPVVTVQANGVAADPVSAGGPGILDVVPAPVAANASANILLRGTNLPLDSVLMVNGRAIPAQVTPGALDQLQAVIPAAAIPAAGQYSLQVVSASNSTIASNVWNWAVAAAAPFSLSKTLVTFPQKQVACGGGVGYTETISIGNGGGGKFGFTTASNAVWLTASPQRGTSPSNFSVTASPDGLAPGQYSGTVAVTFTDGSPGEVDLKVILSVGAPGSQVSGVTSPNVYAIDSLQRVKVADTVPPNGSAFASLAAAGNEYQAFQIVINGGAAGYRNVSVDLTTPFTGAQCGAIPVRLYREHYITITNPSHHGDGGAKAGVYPDALIPFVNPFTGAPIRGGQYPSAPFDVAAGQNQPVYAEVYVPDGTPAGVYSGVVTVSRDGGVTLAQVPMTLTVWGFSLPKKPTLRSSFHAYDSDHALGPAAYYGYANGSREHLSMAVAMDEAMIAHRIIPESPINTSFQVNSQGHLVQDSVVAPKVDALLARPEYSDFSVNLGLHSPFADPLSRDRARTLTYLNDVYQWLSSRGYLEKTWFRTTDEPSAVSDFQTAANFADLIHQGNSNFAVGITTAFDTPYLATYLVGHLNILMMHNTFYDPAFVAARQAAGDRVWSYTAVVQNTANPTPYWQIEFPLLNYRIMPWINYRYGLEGLLYWTTDKWNEVLARGGSMWTDPCSLNDSGTCFNGDGNLFYPGKEVNYVVPANAYGSSTPAAVFGPIASLRVKALRDGMEDYELLALAAKRDPNAAMQVAIQVGCNGLASTGDSTNNCFHNWNKDPNAVRVARAQLAAIAGAP